MNRKPIHRFLELQRELLIEVSGAFAKYCEKNEIKNNYIHVEDICLTHYEMVENPTCVFKGVVIARQENLRIFTHSIGDFNHRTLRLMPYVVDGKRVYEVETTYCYDYITKKVTFAPSW